MDQSTQSWFNKLESSINSFKETYIEKSATMAADLKNLVTQQSDLIKRVTELESWKDQKDGEDKQRERTSKMLIAKWAVVVVGVEILVAIALKFWWI